MRARLRQVNCWGRGAANRVDAEIDGLQIPALISVPRCTTQRCGFASPTRVNGEPAEPLGNVDSIDHVSTLVRTLLRERSIDPLTEVDAVRALVEQVVDDFLIACADGTPGMPTATPRREDLIDAVGDSVTGFGPLQRYLMIRTLRKSGSIIQVECLWRGTVAVNSHPRS